MKLLWTEAAWKEYCNWQNQDKKTLKKLNEIIKDMQRNPCLQKSLLTLPVAEPFPVSFVYSEYQIFAVIVHFIPPYSFFHHLLLLFRRKGVPV